MDTWVHHKMDAWVNLHWGWWTPYITRANVESCLFLAEGWICLNLAWMLLGEWKYNIQPLFPFEWCFCKHDLLNSEDEHDKRKKVFSPVNNVRVVRVVTVTVPYLFLLWKQSLGQKVVTMTTLPDNIDNSKVGTRLSLPSRRGFIFLIFFLSFWGIFFKYNFVIGVVDFFWDHYSTFTGRFREAW